MLFSWIWKKPSKNDPIIIITELYPAHWADSKDNTLKIDKKKIKKESEQKQKLELNEIRQEKQNHNKN